MFIRRPMAAVVLGVALACSPALAQDAHTDVAGKTLYLHYCSSCHGQDGKGGGALAPILQLKPTDLTQLEKNSDGEFSYMDLLQSIDGRSRVRGHGETGMPVWGQVLAPDKDAPVGEQLRAAGKLLLITYYVESLQEK